VKLFSCGGASDWFVWVNYANDQTEGAVTHEFLCGLDSWIMDIARIAMSFMSSNVTGYKRDSQCLGPSVGIEPQTKLTWSMLRSWIIRRLRALRLCGIMFLPVLHPVFVYIPMKFEARKGRIDGNDQLYIFVSWLVLRTE
jgi:hypothetical protein